MQIHSVSRVFYEYPNPNCRVHKLSGIIFFGVNFRFEFSKSELLKTQKTRPKIVGLAECAPMYRQVPAVYTYALVRVASSSRVRRLRLPRLSTGTSSHSVGVAAENTSMLRCARGFAQRGEKADRRWLSAYGFDTHAGHDGKLAFQSDQGRTCDIRDPLRKRCSPQIHFQGWTTWKEAGGALAAVRSKAALMVEGGSLGT